MAYDICKKCERFFEKSGRMYCPRCDDELSLSRQTIDEYLLLNPNASIMEIVGETGVKLKDLNIFLESGGARSLDIPSENNIVNLRKEEIKKEQELITKKESVKTRNKFRSRRLRGE